jgi:preprotein translocase subunit SecB
MNSFTSHKPSFFAPAILFSGLLILALALRGSSAPVVNKRETTETDPTVEIRKQLYWGTRVLTELKTHGVFTSMGISQEDVNNTLPIVSSIG